VYIEITAPVSLMYMEITAPVSLLYMEITTFRHVENFLLA
jgi:hypothetical protein